MRHVKHRLLCAAIFLGVCSGLPVRVEAISNPQLADQYFRSARALHELALSGTHGIHWAEVAHLYAQAAHAGHPDAYADLGYLLLTHPADFAPRFRSPRSRGMDYLMREIAEGDTRAMVLLGYAMEHGYGVTANREGALRLYRRAAEAGHTGAMRRLAEVAGPVEGFGWLERAARAGDEDAMVQLGQRLLEPGPVHNEQAARHWLERARDLGHPLASAELAHLERAESRLRQQLAMMQASEQVLRDQLEAGRRDLAEAEEKGRRWLEQLTRSQEEAVRLRSLMGDLEGELARVRVEADRERRAWQELSAEHAAVRATVQALEGQVSELAEERDRLQRSLAGELEQRSQLEARLDQSARELDARARELLEARREMAVLSDRVAKSRQDMELAHARTSEAEARLEQLHQALTKSETARTALETQLKLAEDQVLMTRQEVRALELERLLAVPLETAAPAATDGSVYAGDPIGEPGEAAYQVAMKFRREGRHERALEWLLAAANAGHTAAAEEIERLHLQVFRERTTSKGGIRHE